jgi:hypothetical protein
VRAGGAVPAGERPTRLAHQDVEGREIPYRYLRLGGDVGRARRAIRATSSKRRTVMAHDTTRQADARLILAS